MDTTDTTDRETVAVAAAARMLRVSRRTVVRWCHSGWLADAIQPGHAWEIPMAAIRARLTPRHPGNEST
jgi:predicted site-specific integrase-resolvase